MPEPEKQRQAFQFYGRRKGRPLRKGRQSLFDELLPRITDSARAGPRTLDPANSVRAGGSAQSGWRSASAAASIWRTRPPAHPDIGFIGCEVFESGIASALSHIAERNLENVRLHPEDARVLLAALKPQSLDRVFLLFPDPWPKRRHAQRRFVQPGNLDRLAELIAPGGELRIASDDPTYVEWTLQHVPVHPAFQWLAQSPADWQERPADAIETRYEKKAREAGRVPHFFRFQAALIRPLRCASTKAAMLGKWKSVFTPSTGAVAPRAGLAHAAVDPVGGEADLLAPSGDRGTGSARCAGCPSAEAELLLHGLQQKSKLRRSGL